MKKVKDITALKKLIKEAAKICDKNISKAHNIDLEDMSQTLDNLLDQLNHINNFETYDEQAYTIPLHIFISIKET